MIIFEFDSYREVIKNYIQTQKLLDKKLTYQMLAETLRMQKSYLSKIMAGQADLSLDQAYLLCEFMQLRPEEKEFLFLLVEYEKAAINELKKELKTKIKTLQTKNTQSDQYLEKEKLKLSSSELQEYYLNSDIQLIHLALGISQFQYNPELIIKKLNLSREVFESSLQLLERLGLIEIQKEKIKLIKADMHLPPSSPFFNNWQSQQKLKSLEWSKKLPLKDKYNFVACFSANDEDKEKIRLEFLNFLTRVEKIVKKSPAENLYQINFDLFKWL